MNKYAECLYNYLMECSFREFMTTPAYININSAYNREENALLRLLTPEQREQFSRHQEQEGRLEEISTQYIFMETLRVARGLLLL